MDMPFGADAFDVVASALVFHFIPDRAKYRNPAHWAAFVLLGEPG